MYGKRVFLITFRYLVAERHFDQIDVFEQQPSFGGAWLYSEPSSSEEVQSPQTDPKQPLDKLIRDPNAKDNEAPLFLTPMYDRLETNIGKPLMAFSDKEFPADLPLFPHRSKVVDYIEDYAQDIKDLVQFKTQVTGIRLETQGLQDSWAATVKDLCTGKETNKQYDAIAVCSGHYDVPNIPDIKGMREWSKAYPKTISHAKLFRRPEQFVGKKLIVVGNAASGIDVATQCSYFCKPPLIISARSEALFKFPDDVVHKESPEIAEFMSPTKRNRAVRFVDGTVEEDVDAVIFCTGYFFTYPFIPLIQDQLIEDGFRVKRTYKHMFWIDHPSMVFLGLAMRVLPMPLGEAQAAVMARIWSGRLHLPSAQAMLKWEQSRIAERGDGKGFHTMKSLEDLDYHDELYDWAASATDLIAKGPQTRHIVMSNGTNGKPSNPGKLPRRWTAEGRYYRREMANMRKAYAMLGEKRFDVHTAKQLGFDFEEEKRRQEAEQASLAHPQ